MLAVESKKHNKAAHKPEHHKKSSKHEDIKHHKQNHKKMFRHPLLKIEDVAKKVKEGYTFKQANDDDFKDKSAMMVTIHLPKSGFLPFRMTSSTPKTIDGKTPVPTKLAQGPK